MSRKPFVILAETYRAGAVAETIRHAIPVRAGERGWIDQWAEARTNGRVMILVDDGSRIEDLLWAAGHITEGSLRLGFLGPRLSENVAGTRSGIARSVASHFGWSPVGQKRSRLLIFECAANSVTRHSLALATRLLNPHRDQSPSEWRVGFVGATGARLLGGWGRSWYLDPRSAGDLEREVGGDLHLVMIDDDPVGWDGEGVARVMDEARRLGIHLIGLSTGARRNVWRDFVPPVDLEIGLIGIHPDGVEVGPGVDVRVVNPIGFLRDSRPALGLVATIPRAELGATSHRDTRDSRAQLVDGASLLHQESPAPRCVEELMRSLRSFRAILDHPRLHESEADRARLISWMACAGLPVVVEDLTDGLADALGRGTTNVLAQGDVASMEHPDLRERYSIDLRRAALRELSLSARLRALGNHIGQEIAPLPSVSVVMATMRPQYLESAIRQLSEQTYPDLEVVIALHGDKFPPGTEQDLKGLDLTVEVVRFDGSHNLGDVLNGAVARASGQLVSKWDDDDWYGPEHLWDLVLAKEYSSADAVGKAAEFVYVSDLDITIRRFPEGADSLSRTLAGGTLTLQRETLGAVGGFPSQPRHVDQGLLSRLAAEGGTSFRTHGFGYVLNRHGVHTWNIATDYFLDASFRQWRGLRLDEAACDTAASLATH